MLKIDDLYVSYGGIKAIRGISLEVPDGKIVTLIGANGAGKSTILRSVVDLVKADSGSITYNGKELLNMPSNKIIEEGITLVPEGRRVFQELTVLENLKLGAFILNDKKRIESNLEYVYTHFPRLKERRGQVAGTLSGGEQQMLAMGRALMSNPKIILMDEPSMGLSPILVSEIFNIIKEVSADGTTVLLVEQNAKKALSIANRAYVLETGKIVLGGTTQKSL